MPGNGKIEKFGDILPQFINSLEGKKKYNEQRVICEWEKIVGADIAKHARADRFSFNTLFISVDSPVWANQLMFLQTEMIEKINKYIGSGLVKEIRYNSSNRAFRRPSGLAGEEKSSGKRKTSPPQKREIERAAELCGVIEDSEVRQEAEKAVSAALALYRDRKGEGWHKCNQCGKLCPPDKKLCPYCERESRLEKSRKIRRILRDCPWISYGEIYKYVPCTAEEANSERAIMAQQLAKSLVYGDFTSLEAKTFVMLAGSIPPENLTEEKIKKVMKRFRWMLINEEEKNQPEEGKAQ